MQPVCMLKNERRHHREFWMMFGNPLKFFFSFLRLFMCRRFRVEASCEELTNFNFKLFKCWNFYDALRMENCFCFSCSAQRMYNSSTKRHRLCNNNKHTKWRGINQKLLSLTWNFRRNSTQNDMQIRVESQNYNSELKKHFKLHFRDGKRIASAGVAWKLI